MKKLFSENTKNIFLGPLSKENPITVQVLGICSALAVTAKLEPALVMGISVTIIVAFSNLIISLMRNTVPNRIRMIVQLVVAAAVVTVVSEILKAYAYDVSVQLSVYIGLIITNCILMGRLEAFAMTNKPWESFVDGLANGLGYAWILAVIGVVRELLGSGTLFDMQIIPKNWYISNGGFYSDNGFMILPPMALTCISAMMPWNCWPNRQPN
jgi:Na+-transporting NADH:ubiquinone oxidoreductase subunit D